MCVTFVTCECVCVALVAIAGRRYTIPCVLARGRRVGTSTRRSHPLRLSPPRMSLARELDDAMSSPSADKLAALAVRARQTDSQTEMVAAGVHHRLPALLQLSQSSCASPDCGTSQQECDLRQMQAQCARLLGNLSYLQAHPNPNANATPKP